MAEPGHADGGVRGRGRGRSRRFVGKSSSIPDGVRAGAEEDGDVDGGRRKRVEEDGDVDGGRRKRAEEMEKRRKRGKRPREGDGEGKDKKGSELKDPLALLGPEVLSKILMNLDACSVACSLLVTRGWHRVASSDSIWGHLLDELWLGKAHLPHVAMTQGLTKLAAYSFSIMDARRTRITKEDICCHVWQFRFQETAPEYWRNLDPSWNGAGPPMRRYFHPDGSVTADPDDKVWGGHECTYSIVTGLLDDCRIREHYVRINRWPKLSVSRKFDWSWEMANQLFCYSSLPDAVREGGTGPSQW